MPTPIDITFDVRSDAGGKDPDSHSAGLRSFHRQLWNKPLPGGTVLELDSQLGHASDLGEFHLASDSIAHTYSTWQQPTALVEVREQVSMDEIASFRDLACTVGAYTVFPRRKYAGGKWHLSINQARGMHPRIADRFDLTLECIRRQYVGLDSPLAEALRWYEDFFRLFDDFSGYVRFFLLDDLVSKDFTSVHFLIDFDDFQRTPLPSASLDEYRGYMNRSMAFIRGRNERVHRYANARGTDR